ncbi:hypothetical protein [Microbacterium sp. 2MCAF23]|uniref:hypothetical protein n=1 Tax=Microbacterium sp. 2MCAF23 TaxID=3232985 RepID=UPI003F9BE713
MTHPRWAALQLATLLTTVACVAVHAAMLLSGPSVLATAMVLLAATCALCLRPRRTPLPDAAWGAAMAMAAAMLLLHIWSGGGGWSGGAGIGVHAHGLAQETTPLDALHSAALGLNALELALVMGAVLAIGVRNRRRAGKLSARG